MVKVLRTGLLTGTFSGMRNSVNYMVTALVPIPYEFCSEDVPMRAKDSDMRDVGGV